MGTYFHGNNNNSEVQPSAEGLQLQTLYLMNPNYVLPYSDAAQHPTQNMLLANPNSPHALNLANFPHAPPSLTPQHHALNNSAFHGHYNTNNNLWGSNSIADQTVPATAASASRSNGSECGVTVAATGETEFPSMGFQRGLSLTLSSQQTLPYGNLSSKVDDDREVSVDGVVLGSKYLKAAQELMDEVVNVAAAGGKGICKGESGDNNIRDKRKANIESSSGFGDCSSGGGGGGSEVLSTQQRQELQIKKSKLVTMLDEVELRYRQYHNQMQMVVSSFEHAVGFGAAKSYTVLALKTISKQFRSLKDAISSQIRTTSKSLGEDDCLGAKVEGSRLRYVDHHLRQQRALQQLGMIQHNAWRPQRGLPERAVSILRAWLFEHFLHPYPKDSDKVMLARQSGLTRSQVSNWFINARVRLWKPMVEEMYNEEIKEQEQNDVSHEKTNRSKDSSKELWSAANNIAPQEHESFNNQNTSDPTEISNSNNSLSPSPIGGGGGGGSFQSHSGFHLADIQRSSSTPKNNSPAGNILSMEMKHGESTNRESNKFEGYGTFSMEDIGRFNVTTDHHQLAPRFHGNGVSLTLGLPHNENLPLSAAASTQHGFLSQNMHLGGGGMGTSENDEFCAINTTTPPPSGTSNYDQSIDIQNRKRFAAQLLRNFVA